MQAVIMPKLEMSQETANVVEWLKKEGASIQKGEPLLMVETDKVTVEIESPGAGILSGVRVKPGETVPVTAVIAYLLQPGENLADASTSPPAVPDGSGHVPASKPTSPSATPLARRIAGANGMDLSRLAGSGPSGRITKADVAAALNRNTPLDLPDVATGKVRATPAARRLARLGGIDLSAVPGSGPRGRIQAGDVTPHSPQPVAFDEARIVPLAGMRRTIAERMQASYQTAPHITFTSRVDLTEFDVLRKRLNARAAAAGQGRVSVTALLVKLAAWTLERHPWLNSSLRDDQIYLWNHVHMGVAVALPDGLIVPVVRHANARSIEEIAAEVEDLIRRAREGKLMPSDVTAGTFTLTNLGPFGIEQFTAILHPGQAGILAVGAAQPEVLVVDGQPAVRSVLRMTLSADHRIVDGAVAAHFMAGLREVMENPGMVVVY